MAWTFNGTSDGMSAPIGAAVNGATKLSVAFKMDWTTYANDDDLAMELSANYNNNKGFIIDPNDSGAGGGGFFGVGINSSGGASATLLVYFSRPSAGMHSYVFNFDAAAAGVAKISSIYVDSVSQTLNIQNDSSVAGSFDSQTLYFMSRAVTSLFGAGTMAEVAIYRDINLNIVDVDDLRQGFSPLSVRSAFLIAYWPMVRANIDIVGATPTLTGTTVSAHPRVIMPRKSKMAVKRGTPVQLQFVGFMGTSGV